MNRLRSKRLLRVTLVLTLLAYAPSLANGFTMDDRDVAKAVLDTGQANRFIEALAPLGDYFGSHYWAGGLRKTGSLYRPVTVLSYALTYRTLGRLSGGSELAEAWPQHALNLLLQLLAVWLVYRMLRLLAGRPASAIAASTFALHAIHSEVVAGIVGRAELLAFCFGAGALLGGEQARRRAGAARALLFGGSAVSLFLAFCSKESAVAWAPFLLVFGMARAWSRQPPGERAAAVPLLGKVAPGVLLLSALPLLAFFVLRHGALGQLEHEVLYFANPLYHAPPATRLLSAGMIWGHGLWLTLFPFRLASDYGIAVFPMIESILDARFLVPALVLSGILIAGLVLARRSPLSFLAMTCFLGFSFLTSNVPFAIGTPFGERLYYTPSLGLAFLAAAFVPWLRARPRVKQAALALLCLWLAACFVRTFDRCLVWKNNRSVFTTDVRIQPRSARLQRGAAWFAEGERKREHLERAVSLYPGYAEAWSDLAGTYVREQNLKKAEDCLRSALSSLKGPGVVVDGYDIHWNLGFLLARTKRDKEAGEHLATALRLRPAQFREQLDRLGDAARRKALELLRGIRER